MVIYTQLCHVHANKTYSLPINANEKMNEFCDFKVDVLKNVEHPFIFYYYYFFVAIFIVTTCCTSVLYPVLTRDFDVDTKWAIDTKFKLLIYMGLREPIYNPTEFSNDQFLDFKAGFFNVISGQHSL